MYPSFSNGDRVMLNPAAPVNGGRGNGTGAHFGYSHLSFNETYEVVKSGPKFTTLAVHHVAPSGERRSTTVLWTERLMLAPVATCKWDAYVDALVLAADTAFEKEDYRTAARLYRQAFGELSESARIAS